MYPDRRRRPRRSRPRLQQPLLPPSPAPPALQPVKRAESGSLTTPKLPSTTCRGVQRREGGVCRAAQAGACVILPLIQMPHPHPGNTWAAAVAAASAAAMLAHLGDAEINGNCTTGRGPAQGRRHDQKVCATMLATRGTASHSQLVTQYNSWLATLRSAILRDFVAALTARAQRQGTQ